MILTYVYHVRSGTKVYYRNTYRVDESQYLETVQSNKDVKYSFISDLTQNLPPEGYPNHIYDLLNYLNQFTCVKNHSNNTIAYKDDSSWEKDLFP